MLFHENKYTKWYLNLISNRKNSIEPEFGENHHIIPKCLGGTDEEANIIRLKPKDHFIAHLLLCKMNDNPKLKFAFHMMCHCNNSSQQRTYQNANSYALCKSMVKEECRKRMKGHKGHNKDCITITDGINQMFIDKNEKIPEGWYMGISTSTRVNMKGKNKGRTYYYNKETGKVISLKDSDLIPDNFIKGNPAAVEAGRNSGLSGSKYYHNSNGEEKRFVVHPGDGWYEGRSVIWITNNILNKLIPKLDILPDGWYYGKTNKKYKEDRNNSYITDEFKKKVSKKTKEVTSRDTYKSYIKGKNWYYDPLTNKNYYLSPNEAIPNNLIKGLKHKNKTQ